ncbi:gfo/Idh/MocA family oxidoreductase [bacterium]|nr:gfo/Idh/MocA family oxidoreductase [bacterium]
MPPLRFAIFGTGFWSRYQLAAWQALEDVECVALYNRTIAKAEALGREFGVPAVYADPEELLDKEQLDFIDIITDVDTHSRFVHMAADRGVAVICQKPMAPSLETCEEMVAACRAKGVPFFVHENWRWQTQIRAFHQMLNSGRIGKPFRARIHYVNSFPVFANQPFLAELEQFILTDIGSHILDASRFLFGEAQSLYCQTHHVYRDLKGEPVQGEDVATVMMPTDRGLTVTCEMSYASRTEIERFPETYIYVEGSEGFLELGPDFWIRETTAEGTFAKRVRPPHYEWADPAYDLVHASILPCNADILKALRGEGQAETTGEDNLKTMKLVYGAYESAEKNVVLKMEGGA